MKRIIGAVLGGALLSVILWLVLRDDGHALAALNQSGPASAARGQASSNEMNGDQEKSGSAGAKHSARPQAAPRVPILPSDDVLSGTEERVVTMYDEIARKFADPDQSCDVLGAALAESVNKYAVDLHQWAQSRSGLDEEQRASAEKRLAKLAGRRLETAQNSLRRAMTSCMTNQRFQESLGDLVALGTVHENP